MQRFFMFVCVWMEKYKTVSQQNCRFQSYKWAVTY